ncbi:hypothetical protein [Mycolicibacterium elephantis]|nr:hypothetical protein [Mycolicibacterium elephantis]
MVQLDHEQFRAVRHCVLEVVRRRLLAGAPENLCGFVGVDRFY